MSQHAAPLCPWVVKPGTKRVLVDFLVLALITWLAHYFYLRYFGLYEDDYTYISRPLGWHLHDLIQQLRNVWRAWPQGRPIATALPQTLAFLGGKLHGLSAIYLLGYLVHTVSAWLFYLLLERSAPRLVALLGAVVLILFPADTTHILLTHSLQLHASLMFVLVAGLLYFSRWRILSYVLALASLLTYESPYMVFLAIPLLGQTWDRKLAKDMLRHAAIWLGILLVVVAIRIGQSESRIEMVASSPASIAVAAGQTLEALIIGPAVSLASFEVGPAWIVTHWTQELTFVFLVSFAVFAWILSRRRVNGPAESSGSPLNWRVGIFGRELVLRFPNADNRTIGLLPVSLVMLSVAYGFSFTHFPPTDLYGRATSVHLAATLGGSLLFACLCSLFLDWTRSHRFQLAGIVLVAVYLSLLVAYRFGIQLDFKQAWLDERAFWTASMALSPDLADGTMIFVLNHDLPATHFILANSWADPIMLPQIFQFPEEWKTPPRLFVVSQDWPSTLIWNGSSFNWEVPAATWVAHSEAIPDSNVILLEMEGGRLVRRFGSLLIQGHTLDLKPLPAHARRFRPGPIYPLLIANAK